MKVRQSRRTVHNKTRLQWWISHPEVSQDVCFSVHHCLFSGWSCLERVILLSFSLNMTSILFSDVYEMYVKQKIQAVYRKRLRAHSGCACTELELIFLAMTYKHKHPNGVFVTVSNSVLPVKSIGFHSDTRAPRFLSLQAQWLHHQCLEILPEPRHARTELIPF